MAKGAILSREDAHRAPRSETHRATLAGQLAELLPALLAGGAVSPWRLLPASSGGMLAPTPRGRSRWWRRCN
jgi:hypothetical protein